MKWLRRLVALLLVAVLAAAAWLWHVNFNDGVDLDAEHALPADRTAYIERGAYLARIGNCLACHTARGGMPAAGGLAIATPFGAVFSSNLTPDEDTGIGRWSANAFWRALHHGRSAGGRLLVPVFPYTHTTLLTRVDVDALFAYFQSLPPEHAPTPPHELRWPYGTQPALALWRARYFQPGSFEANPEHDASWNRGAYLAQGVAHCSACHAKRDALGGADWRDLRGGMLPAQGWYAPSLLDPAEASVANWSVAETVRLLTAGVATEGRASGPMAEVVFHGTQHLSDDDAAALAGWLRTLPQISRQARQKRPASVGQSVIMAGEQIYRRQCADCHGAQGEGKPPAYPPLASNRAVTMNSVDNLLQTVLYGGFNAATEGYPRPFGMPPFMLTLNDREIAAVLSYIRSAWGNEADAVTQTQVHGLRARKAASAR